MTRVVHCKKEKYDVYIGRPNKWGNPYLLKDFDRETCIKLFEMWFRKHPLWVENAKKELKGKVLGCWCNPKPCHGDVLARIAEE